MIAAAQRRTSLSLLRSRQSSIDQALADGRISKLEHRKRDAEISKRKVAVNDGVPQR